MTAGDAVRGKLKRLKDLRWEMEGDVIDAVPDEFGSDEEFRVICLEIATEVLEREVQADALEARIKEMQERKQRILHSAETLRNIVLQCMETRGVKSIPSPEMTLTVASRSPGIVVTDESAIPSQFFEPQPPKLDKKALKEAVLGDGEIIPGVTVGNGGISLTIRRK